MRPILIKGGRVVDPSQGIDRTADVLLEDRLVAAVGPDLEAPGEARVIDAEGLVVCPGLIDIHVHFRDPGEEYKEDIGSGARAAAAGGFTAVATMANTDPVVDNTSGVRYVLDQAASACGVRVFPIGAVSQGMGGKQLAEMGRMKRAGAVAFSDDGQPVVNGDLMRNALAYAGGLGSVVIVHEEDPHLVANGVMHEGAISSVLGLRGVPPVAEEAMIARDIMLARITGARLHIAHLSTRDSVEMVRQAKAQGVPVTAEVTAHHLLLTDRVVKDLNFDTDTRVNPPIRSEDHRLALWEGLLDGTIDAVASDHAPHHPDDKDVEYDFAPAGIAGVEISLALLLDELARGTHGDLGLSTLIERMSTGPARVLGLPGGTLRPDSPADVTVIDLERKLTVDPESWQSKSQNTPFKGRNLRGGPLFTIVGGRVVMEEGEIVDHED